MTVAVEDRSVSYTTTGTTLGPFTVTFPFYEIEVLLNSAVVDPADYVINQSSPGETGDITFVSDKPSGTLTINGKTTQAQQIDFISTDTVEPESAERGLDRLTMIAQELQLQIDNQVAADLSNIVETINTGLGGPTWQNGAITPYEYGAVGDGVTDDTTALQAFFDDLRTKVGYSYGDLGNGVFLVSDTILVRGNAVTLYDGYYTVQGGTIKASSSFWTTDNGVGTDPKPVLKVSTNNYHCVLRDIRIDCGTYAGGGFLVETGAAFHTYLQHCIAYNYKHPAYANEAAYNPDYATSYNRLVLTVGGGTSAGNGMLFTDGETVTGGTSGATGTIYTRPGQELYVLPVSGTFTTGETITGGTSAETAVIFSQRTVIPPPPASTNTYRPYGFRVGPADHTDSSVASTMCYIDSCHAYQWNPGSPNITDDTKYTGIGFWLHAGDCKVDRCTVSAARKCAVVDGFLNSFSQCHFFPINNATSSNSHEWIGYELNDGPNSLVNNYLDSSMVWANNPAQNVIGNYCVRFTGGSTNHNVMMVLAPQSSSEVCHDLHVYGNNQHNAILNQGSLKVWNPNGNNYSGLPRLTQQLGTENIAAERKQDITFNSSRVGWEYRGGASDGATIRFADANTTESVEFGCAGNEAVIYANSSERVRINSSGRVIINSDTALAPKVNNGAITPQLQVLVNGSSASALVARFTADTGAPMLVLGKSRNGTIGGQTVVNSGDILGRIAFCGSDGTEFQNGASIEATVDAAPGTADMPTSIDFLTSADGSSTPTKRWRMRTTGHLNPATDNTYDIGAASLRIRDIYQAGYHSFLEESDPGSGPADTARLYARDNGSGKTQLCVVFSSGAVQVLATQP